MEKRINKIKKDFEFEEGIVLPNLAYYVSDLFHESSKDEIFEVIGEYNGLFINSGLVFCFLRPEIHKMYLSGAIQDSVKMGEIVHIRSLQKEDIDSGSFIRCFTKGKDCNYFHAHISESMPTISTDIKGLNCPNKHYPMFIFSINDLKL